MGNKKKRNQTNPDLALVRKAFQKNIDRARKAQRGEKRDLVACSDLEDKYASRRTKAVLRLLPEMRKRYEKLYPDLDITKEFAEFASLPALTYDLTDKDTSICLGAAFWMLDRFWEDRTIAEAIKRLPEDYKGVVCPDVYDVRFHHSIFKKLLLVIQRRYGQSEDYVVPEGIFEKRDNNDTFHELLELLPKAAVDKAVEHTKAKFWEWADLYFETLEPINKEYNNICNKMDRLDAKISQFFDDEAKSKKLTFPFNMSMLPTVDDNDLERKILEQEQLIQRFDDLEQQRGEVNQKAYLYRFKSLTAGFDGDEELTSCIGSQCAKKLTNFPIEDPYEICFAILYLLDQDDDYAWAYSFMVAVVCRASAMLPWAQDMYIEQCDEFWFENGEWIEPKPLNPEWYETKYAYSPYLEEDDDEHDVSLAQIIYQYTGAVIPRDTDRFEKAKKELRKMGLKPSQASMMAAVMNIVGEVSRQRTDYINYLEEDSLDNTGNNNPIEDTASNATQEELVAENEKLKQELIRLRKQAKETAYNFSRDNRDLQDKLEKVNQQVQEDTAELASLREAIFNLQADERGQGREETEAKVEFPYHTSRRLVVFGGHDSFLREIKPKLPDVRFMGDDLSSPEVIRRADVIWIQTNCIGHKLYYGIINLARKYNRKVRYFGYASATKCAEQVVEEEKRESSDNRNERSL